jgi:DNA-binding LytR/AlgR family response regulator
MTPLQCLIVDDEPNAIQVIRHFIGKVPFLSEAYATSQPEQAFSYLLSQEGSQADILFLDIDMPGMDGLELARLLRQNGSTLSVIFTTAHRDYALDSFEVNATDYLLKPILLPRFLQAVEKVVRKKETVTSPENNLSDADGLSNTSPSSASLSDTSILMGGSLFVRTGIRNQYFKVSLQEIVFVEANEAQVNIWTEDGKLYETVHSMKEMEERLPGNLFLRVHKSYLLNLSKIIRFDRDFAYVRLNQVIRNTLQITEKPVSIGKTYLDTLKARLRDSIVDRKIF